LKSKKNKQKLEDAFKEFIYHKDLGGCGKRTLEDNEIHFYYFQKFSARNGKKFLSFQKLQKKYSKSISGT
jgi:hypothetical protein